MPLRPELYRRLKGLFRHVEIANEGEEMTATYLEAAFSKRKSLNATSAGEYLRVNCPYCNDTRFRLWINHRWGLYDPETKSRNLWLCICYNEDCFRQEGRYQDLYNLVFSDFEHEARDYERALTIARPAKQQPQMITAVTLPGCTALLHSLPSDHEARKYLEARNYDPDELAKYLKVGVSLSPDDGNRMAKGRIVIPFYMNGRLVGWTARYVGEPPADVPKYYTMRSMKKSHVLYNFDHAKASPYVIVCEGSTDVWRAGPSSVALLGKTLSATQKNLLVASWGDGAVVILLDGDAHAEAQEIYDSLAGQVRQRVLVLLPKDKDPSDLSSQELSRLILAEAKRQKVDLRSLTRAAKAA